MVSYRRDCDTPFTEVYNEEKETMILNWSKRVFNKYKKKKFHFKNAYAQEWNKLLWDVF